MELSDIIGPQAVKASLKVSSKKRLLQELAEFAEAVYDLPAAETYKAFMDREALGPTGVGHGVGIPHARFTELDRVCGLFIRLEKAVDFEAVDRKPVDLVFALFAPEAAGADHLKALARVSRTLRDNSIRDKLRSTHDATALHAILTSELKEKAA